MLIGVSYWVRQDAIRRNMNPLWGIGVGLMLIFFLPLYLLVRKPVKCTVCGKNIASSRSVCEECEQTITGDPGDGRPGRLFG
jgi:hypothetical protein